LLALQPRETRPQLGDPLLRRDCVRVRQRLEPAQLPLRVLARHPRLRERTERREPPKRNDVLVESTVVQAAFEAVAEQRRERLPFADGIEQPRHEPRAP
jgi:hypothetical protein